MTTDLRDAGRALSRDSGVTLLTLLTLALTIGATTALFSIVRGVLVRPLPYPGADRLVRVAERRSDTPSSRQFRTLSNHTYWAWRDGTRTLQALACYGLTEQTVSTRDEPVRLTGATVSPELFGILSAVPSRGRLFRPGDEAEGNHVVVLSHQLWRARFAADPDIVGRTVVFDNVPFVVVGVAEAGFYFPDREAQYWVPMRVPQPNPSSEEQAVYMFSALGRLAPGATPAQAAAEATTVAQAVAPNVNAAMALQGSAPPTAEVTPLLADITREYRPGLLAMMGAVVLLLGIGVANVASLTLTRAVTRRRELAIRASMGATAGRLARQLLVESLLLAAAGGAAGLLVAWWINQALPALLPAQFPRIADITIDWRVVLFAAAVSLVAGIGFGVAPALSGTRVDLRDVLHEGGDAAGGAGGRLRPNRLRAALVVAQLTLSLALLIGAGLLLRSFARLTSIDQGYNPANVLTAQISFPREGTTRASRDLFVTNLLERTRGASNVQAAGVTALMPLVPGAMVLVYDWPGRTDGAGKPLKVRVGFRVVSPGYVEAMGLRVVRGRSLMPDDDGPVPKVLVNEAFVRTYLPGLDPLSTQLPFRETSAAWEIVGVVADVRYQGLDATPEPEIYLSYLQLPERMAVGFRVFLAIRSTGDPVALVPTLRAIVRALDSSLALSNVMTMEQRIAASVAQRRFFAVVLGAFSLIALLLAAAGLYGVVSRNVAHRQREIGVRTALGARTREIVTMVFRQGLGLTLAGVVLGIAVALALTRYLSSLLYGIGTRDPLTFVIVPLLLVLVATVATFLPARRAARTDPVAALRAE
jgi:predicted permease